MANVVPISHVIPNTSRGSSYFINRLAIVLQKQGQIEPLQVREVNGKYIVWNADPYGNELVYAARDLEWPTLLITVTKRYHV